MKGIKINSKTCRSCGHFISAILIMWIYGGQVCPLVETIALSTWLFELLIIFTSFYWLRLFIAARYIKKIAYHKKVIRQFYFELIYFIIIGITIAMTNQIFYDFSLMESGPKMIFGTATLGFFMAVDMALEQERAISHEISRNHQKIIVDQYYFPMTRKFAIIACVTVITASVVIILVILKDLSWMTTVTITELKAAKLSVLKEILFITSIFLIHIFNIILSYAKNLRLSVEKENRVLADVANGNLGRHVVVSSNDEFGIMAQYTNIMIDKLSQKTRQVRQTRDVTIMALATLAETRDNETGAHLLRTQYYVRAVASHLKDHPNFCNYLDKTTIDLLYKSAPLHDIGKVGVPDKILLKPEKLDYDEFQIMKKHTIYGKQALEKAAKGLKKNNFLQIAQQIAYSHHENWDGTGYPLGLKADEIPISGRLMAIADVYDALISKRVYKPSFSHDKSMEIIKKGRGTHFDPDILDAFVQIENEVIAIAKRFGDELQTTLN